MQALNNNFPEKTIEVWFKDGKGYTDVTYTTPANLTKRIKRVLSDIKKQNHKRYMGADSNSITFQVFVRNLIAF